MKTFLSLVLFAMLAACGGGGSSAPQLISMYGDSLTTGDPAGTPPPIRLGQLLGPSYQVEMRAVGGVTVHEALRGDPSPQEWPWKPFAEQVAIDKPSIVIIRLGGADAVYGTSGDAFKADLTEMVESAKAAGVTVYLVGVIQCPMFPTSSATMDTVNQEVAAAEGVSYIYLRDLPFDPAVDLGSDSLHPTQVYSDRIVQRIADRMSRS